MERGETVTTKEDRKRIETHLERMLQGGETVDFEVARELFREFDGEAATRAYLMGKLRTWVHKIATRDNALAMSVGPGQGYKFAQTPDEQWRVFSFALNRLKGERNRMDKARKVINRLKDSGQLTLEMWEKMEEARRAALADRPSAVAQSEERELVLAMKEAK